MATIRMLTAARTKAIEALAIISGSVNAAGDLTLTRNNGATIAAGNIKGPKGDPGTAGNPLASYPVGAIYLSVVSTSPQTLFGGTWVRWGVGKMPVSLDTSQTEFDTVEETGGTKTETLTVDQMAAHSHPQGNTTLYGGGATNNLTGRLSGQGTSGSGVTTTAAGAPDTASVGGGQPHNNLPPYIVCYMWKRTA